MKNILPYKCQTPVVLIIFNRPLETIMIINAIKKVEPKQIFVIGDGPRQNNPAEIVKVQECRDIINMVDWDCKVTKIFSDVNLGCMKRIVTGLNIVFENVDKAIILEDDCIPTIDFFKFTEWGLNEFQNDPSIGMISGSNLIAHKYKINTRNGFSSLINIWGWATWRYVWFNHDPYPSMAGIKQNMKRINKEMKFNWWQSIYWKELFKYTIYSYSTWDFQLQYSFFKMNLLSVYPCENLVQNIGFDGNGTHTNIKAPKYIVENNPRENTNIFKIAPDKTKKVSIIRDNMIASEIWHYNFLIAMRIRIMNFIRYKK